MDVAVAPKVEPHLADNPRWREEQRLRLRTLRLELEREGADGSRFLAELADRAARWPE